MASESGVGAAWEAYREASQRFEYFILGVSVALVAYAGKSLEPQKLGFTPHTVEVLALFLLIASVAVGFKRIEQIILVHHINVDVLNSQDRRGEIAQAFMKGGDHIIPHLGELWKPADMQTELKNLDLAIPQRQEEIEKINAQITRLYRWRNWLLGCGFLGFFFAKILTPYWQ